MQQRGRKSRFAVIKPDAPSASQPAPPKDLTPEALEIWQRVLDALPPQWIKPEHLDMLESYARHAAAARRYALERDAWPMGDADDILVANRLSTMAERESRAALSLARSMRITHQAQVHRETAGRMSAQRGGGGKKPWE